MAERLYEFIMRVKLAGGARGRTITRGAQFDCPTTSFLFERFFMRRILASFLCIGLIISPVWADGPSRAKLGAKMPNLVLEGDKSQQLALHDLKDKKAIV